MKIGIKGRDHLDLEIKRARQGQCRFESGKRVMASIHRDDNLSGRLGLFRVFHDEDVRLSDTPNRSFGYTADNAFFNRADANGPHNHQVVAVLDDIINKHLKVFPFQRPSFQRNIACVTFLLNNIKVGIGNNLKPAGNQRVVYFSLPFQLGLVVIFFGKARLHLFESFIMQLGCIGVTSDHTGPKLLGQQDPQINRGIRMV